MDKREHKSKLFARRRPIVAAFSIVCRFLCVLLIAGLAPSLATSSDLQRPSVPAVAPGLPFAIADFDGDLHPDLASVQIGSSDPTHSVYWIRLQLTAFGRQSIRVVGPAGGLQLLARDVNGDHAIDLVVMTAGLGEPVAVFLNDGHGGFSQADKNVFPGAFGDSAQNFASPADSLSGAAGVPPQTRIGISSHTRALRHLRPGSCFLAPQDCGFPRKASLICHPGRAPPRSISIS